MILKTSEISKHGVRVEQNVNEYVVQSAIQNAELLVLRPMIGNSNYNKLVKLSQEEPTNVLLVGGAFVKDYVTKYIAGANCSIANIAFAFLIHNKMVATAFGSVIKESDLSRSEDAFKYAKINESIGEMYIRELADAMGVEKVGKSDFNMWGIK